MGCLTVNIERKGKLTISQVARVGALRVLCSLVCNVGETYEIFNASDGEFLLVDGSLMYVLRKNVLTK